MGNGVGGVSLVVRKGWGNTEEGEVIKTIATGADGSYAIELPFGNYTLNASKDGYVTTTIDVVVQRSDSGSQNGTMTPANVGDAYRVVRTCNENPRDLDSHVEGTLSSGNDFHVYFWYLSMLGRGTRCSTRWKRFWTQTRAVSL